MPSHPLLLAAGSLLDAHPSVLVDAAAEAGFAGVGLRLSAEHALEPPALATLGRQVADVGLVVHDVEVHRIGATTGVPHRLIDAAATVGARALLVVSDVPDRPATEAALGEVSAACRAAGIQAAIEYMAWTTPATVADALALARSADCQIVVDLLHHARIGAGASELRTLAASGRVGWVQLSDGPATAPADLVHEARHDRLLPGEGELPLAGWLGLAPPGVPVSVEVQQDRLLDRPPRERARALAAAGQRVLSDRR